jgi:predicted dinucleotide-binding enzyme
MDTKKANNARQRFLVTSYLAANIDNICAILTNTDRARHVSEALGFDVTVSKLTTAAAAADIVLERVRAPKAAPGSKLAQLHKAIFDRLEALEERFTILEQRLGALATRL